VLFMPLPAGWPSLERAVQAMEEAPIAAPPDDPGLGMRLRARYRASRADDYRGVSRREMRLLPFACWIEGQPDLRELEPRLVDRYWKQLLPGALRRSSRSADRWLSPLLVTYCVSFDASSIEFMAFSAALRAALDDALGPLADSMRDLSHSLDFLNPKAAPATLAQRLVAGLESPLQEHLRAMKLWSGFLGSALGLAVWRAALTRRVDERTQLNVIDRLLSWDAELPARSVKTDFRVLFAEALLATWADGRNRVPDDVKQKLVGYFLRYYGDPRDPRCLQYQYAEVSERALGVLLHWLTGDTLRGFMRLLERTADDIWQYREKFWMAYYDRGFIEEAWLALGRTAVTEAKRLAKLDQGLGYGRLEGPVSHDQSVLLLRIGDLIFSEWSHNGSLRAYRESDPNAPRLYRSAYDGALLRGAVSMDFHDGQNMNPELRHMNSDGGTWQRKARDFIRRNTNIPMEDRSIL
jgi:hypothetical protein